MTHVSRRTLTAALMALAIAVPLTAGIDRPAAQAIGDTPSYASADVFVQGESGYVTMYIAGILAISDTRVFAWTDARYSLDDGSPSDAVMKVSDDGGQTWGPLQVMGSGVVGGVPTHNVTQPSMVQDRVSGRIFYFYTVRERVGGVADPHVARIFVRTSVDGGDTFGAPVLVSDALVASDAAMQAAITGGTAPTQFAGETASRYGREFFVIGPGLPIQLSATHPSAANRIVVPVFAIKDRDTTVTLDRGYGDMMLISDDGGVTWEAGGIAPIGTYFSNESSVVELSTGQLYLNSRVRLGGDTTRRSFSVSSDGDSWTKPALIPTSVVEPFIATHAGLLALSSAATDPNGVNRILFSYPDSTTIRSKLTVAISYDDHVSFRYSKLVVPGSVVYSNMAVRPDGTILLAYTSSSAGVRKLIVARFNLEWLTDGADSLDNGPAPLIVDDGGVGYSQTGAWEARSASTGYYGAGYRHDGTAGADPSMSAMFTPTLLVPGTYNVYLRWPDGANRPDAAPITIAYAGGTLTDTTQTINQQVGGNTWHLIGSYAMKPGSGDGLLLSAADAGFTIADAAMFEYVGP